MGSRRDETAASETIKYKSNAWREKMFSGNGVRVNKCFFFALIIMMTFSFDYMFAEDEDNEVSPINWRIDNVQFSNISKKNGDYIEIEEVKIDLENPIGDLITNVQFLKKLSKFISKNETIKSLTNKLENGTGTIGIENIKVSEINSVFLKESSITFSITSPGNLIEIVQKSNDIKGQLTLEIDKANENGNASVKFEVVDYPVSKFFKNTDKNSIINEDARISGYFEMAISQDFSETLIKGQKVKITNLDLNSNPLFSNILDKLDFVKDHKIAASTVEIQKMGLGMGLLFLENIDILNSELNVRGCDLSLDDTNYLEIYDSKDAKCEIQFHKFDEISRINQKAPFINFIKSELKQQNVPIKVTGHILFPEIQVQTPNVFYEHFLKILKNSKNYDAFKSKYYQYINSNNPELAISTHLAQVSLFEKITSYVIREDKEKTKVELEQLKNDNLKLSSKFPEEFQQSMISNAKMAIESKMNQDQESKDDPIISLMQRNNEIKKSRTIIDDSLKMIETDIDEEILKKGVSDAEFYGIAFLAVPVLDKTWKTISFKYTKKLITARNKEIFKEISKYSIRQAGNLIGGEAVNSMQPLLEKLIHGNHQTGHKNLSKFLFGSSFNNIHTLMDKGGGGFHRFYNHDITTILKMGKRNGFMGAANAATHLLQDFTTKDGIRIFTPEFTEKALDYVGYKGNSKVLSSKYLSMSIYRMANGIRVAYFATDTLKTVKKVVDIFEQNKARGFKRFALEVFSEEGYKIGGNPSFSQQFSKRILNKSSKNMIEKIPAIKFANTVNAIMWVWLAYDIYDLSSEYYHFKTFQEPLEKSIYYNLMYNNYFSAIESSKKLYYDDKKDVANLMSYLSIYSLLSPGSIISNPVLSGKENINDYYQYLFVISDDEIKSSDEDDVINFSGFEVPKKWKIVDAKLNAILEYNSIIHSNINNSEKSSQNEKNNLNWDDTKIIEMLVNNYTALESFKKNPTASNYTPNFVKFKDTKIKEIKNAIYVQICYLNTLSRIMEFSESLNANKTVGDLYKKSLYGLKQYLDESSQKDFGDDYKQIIGKYIKELDSSYENR